MGQLCETCVKIHDRCYCAPNSTCSEYEPAKRVALVWNVYRHNFGSGKIEATNIFNHWKFDEDVQTDLRKCRNRNEFAERLRKNLMYYFWSKCEHEVIISSWPYTDAAAEKVDVYQQVMMNFEIFCEYVWSYRKEVCGGQKKNPN